jgi:hypothetical protein
MEHKEIVEVLEHLLIDRLWTLRGTPTNQIELDSMLEYHDTGNFITFSDIKNKYESSILEKAAEAQAKMADKAALLAKLGITADEARLLLS